MTQQLGLFDGASQNAAALEAPLSIRRSRRARRLILRVVPPHTLELVVPFGTRPAEVSSFVTRHSQWISDARSEIAARYPRDTHRLPVRIDFVALGKSWTVDYGSCNGERSRCKTVAGRLEVRSRDAEPATAARKVREWLLEQARQELKPWLLREARALGLRPSAVQIRLQRTRWGSCSSTGSISLNAALLFLDAPLVRYLFVHELCHLLSLNHSRKFWSAVARFEPDYRTLDRRLSDAWSEVPMWVYERRPRR